jgi:hypothetical protein
MKFCVKNVGPGLLGYLFKGSKTECLKFLAYVLKMSPKAYVIAPL